MSLKKLAALWLLAIFVFVGSLFASSWQFERHQSRLAFSQFVSQTMSLPTTTLDSAAVQVAQWQKIEISGEFIDEVLLIRNRPLNGRNGFWVVSNFQNLAGYKYPVLIGWISAQRSASSIVMPPNLPTGRLTLAGIAREFEVIQTASDLPAGQVLTFDKELLQSSPNFFIQTQKIETSQTIEIQPVPIPNTSQGPHLFYALQWLVFAAISVLGAAWFSYQERSNIKPKRS